MPGQQVRHPIFARVYTRISTRMEDAGVGVHRHDLLAGLAGSVLEVGAGNGLNFSHYPATVTSVLAVEPEQYLRALAAGHAQLAAVPVTVTDGTAEQLPAEDASVDNVVATLMLCSVADQQAALAEMHRVLRPGGELRFMEHVLAESQASGASSASPTPPAGHVASAAATPAAIRWQRSRRPDSPLPN